MISLSDFTKQHPGVKLFRVSDARKTPIRQPAFVAFAPKIDRSKRFLVEPQINVVEHRDATALAASDFILRDGYCIHPDQFVPERDVCMSERYGVTKLDLRKRQMQHVFESSLHMKAAISLLGQCAGNYAHFLTEVLPKLPVIDQIPAYKGLPILVDDRIHQNHIEAIKLFNTKGREIVRVQSGHPVRCERLISISPVACAPPEYRTFVEQNKMPVIPPDAYEFSTYALSLLREKARSTPEPKTNWIGKRVYIKRRALSYGNDRNIINASNVEDFALRSGFDLLEPSSLTIQEQIDAFRDVEEVIAPIGAALANLVFTKPGCKVTCLSAYFDGGEYDYWSTLMAALGHELKFVVGPQIETPGGHPLHHDYRISMSDLAAAIADEPAPSGCCAGLLSG